MNVPTRSIKVTSRHQDMVPVNKQLRLQPSSPQWRRVCGDGAEQQPLRRRAGSVVAFTLMSCWHRWPPSQELGSPPPSPFTLITPALLPSTISQKLCPEIPTVDDKWGFWDSHSNEWGKGKNFLTQAPKAQNRRLIFSPPYPLPSHTSKCKIETMKDWDWLKHFFPPT